VVGIDLDTTEHILWSIGAPGTGSVVIPRSRTFNATDFGGELEYRQMAIDFAPRSPSLNNVFGLDNIQFAEIPEPTTVAFLMFGSLLCLRARSKIKS
jgi:hypothetical protein